MASRLFLKGMLQRRAKHLPFNAGIQPRQGIRPLGQFLYTVLVIKKPRIFWLDCSHLTFPLSQVLHPIIEVMLLTYHTPKTDQRLFLGIFKTPQFLEVPPIINCAIRDIDPCSKDMVHWTAWVFLGII